MNDEYILSKLETFNLNIAELDPSELFQFLDLARNIEKEDYDKGLDFVMSRKKLDDKSAYDKFKYFCGYLQKIKKIYQYQKEYAKRD